MFDRAVVKKRKAFEYKLRRKVKEKADFLNYIQVVSVQYDFHFCHLMNALDLYGMLQKLGILFS